MSDLSVPERQRSMPEEPAEITLLQGVLSDDQKKVAVTVELSNGMTHPDIELSLYDAEKKLLSHTTILENFGPRVMFTMHTRQQTCKFPLSVSCSLSYLNDQVFSEKSAVVS